MIEILVKLYLYISLQFPTTFPSNLNLLLCPLPLMLLFLFVTSEFFLLLIPVETTPGICKD